MPRRKSVLLVLLAGIALGSPAAAHTPARVEIVAPAEGATITSSRLTVEIRAVGGTSPADFRLFLNGQPIDTTGSPDPKSLFLDFRVASGESREVPVRVLVTGAHELRVRYKADQGHEPPDVVRHFRFTASSAPQTTDPSGPVGGDDVITDSNGAVAVVIWVIGLAALAALLVFGGRALRRRH